MAFVYWIRHPDQSWLDKYKGNMNGWALTGTD